jgi:hypothetical protein
MHSASLGLYFAETRFVGRYFFVKMHGSIKHGKIDFLQLSIHLSRNEDGHRSHRAALLDTQPAFFKAKHPWLCRHSSEAPAEYFATKFALPRIWVLRFFAEPGPFAANLVARPSRP